MRIARNAMKTTIVAESGLLVAAMPISFTTSLASLAIVIGWGAWKVIERRQNL